MPFHRYKRGAAHCICNLRCSLPREIPIVMHDGLNYDFHLIIKILKNKFDSRNFNRLGGNAETYISFSVSLNKDIEKWKNSTKAETNG